MVSLVFESKTLNDNLTALLDTTCLQMKKAPRVLILVSVKNIFHC